MQVNNDVEADVVDAVRVSLNTRLGSSAVLEFWQGTMPVDCETADTGSLVASCPMSSTPFDSQVGNDIPANAITPDGGTNAGVTEYFRLKDGASNCIAQGTVGESAAEIIIDDDTFSAFDILEVTSFNLTVQAVTG